MQATLIEIVFCKRVSNLHRSCVSRVLQERGLTWDQELRKQIHAWREEGLKSPYLTSFLLDMYGEDLENKRCDAAATLILVKEVIKTNTW